MPATLSYTYPNATKPSLIVPLQDNAPSFRIGRTTKLVGLDGREISGIPDQFSVQRDGAEWLLTNLGVNYLTFSREGSDGSCTLIPKKSNTSLKVGDSINIKFCTQGGVEHKFTLTVADEVESKKRPIKEVGGVEDEELNIKKQASEPAAAATGAADGAGATAFHLPPSGGVPPSSGGMPGWGSLRVKQVIFDAPIDKAAAAANAKRNEFLRRRRERMESDRLGGAPGGSAATATQAMGGGADETQAMGGGADETQAMGGAEDETQAMGGAEDETQAMGGGEDETQCMGLGGNGSPAPVVHVVDERYAVLTVIHIPKADVGVRLNTEYELQDDFSIGRENCSLILSKDKDTFSRKCVTVSEHNDTSVAMKVLNRNGVVVKNADGVDHIIEPRDRAIPTVHIDFGGEFSIRRGGEGNEGPTNYLTFKVTKPV